jgi:hypothetical protein
MLFPIRNVEVSFEDPNLGQVEKEGASSNWNILLDQLDVATGKSKSFVNQGFRLAPICTSYRGIYPIMRPSILAALGVRWCEHEVFANRIRSLKQGQERGDGTEFYYSDDRHT